MEKVHNKQTKIKEKIVTFAVSAEKKIKTDVGK